MSLENWCKAGWLHELEPDPAYIASMMKKAWRDLKLCQCVEDEDDGWCHSMAYAAILKAATVALAAKGYRTAGNSHHYRALKSLVFTIGIDQETVDKLDKHRKKRHITFYGTDGVVTKNDANYARIAATDILEKVHQWLLREHPELIAKT